VTLRKAEGRLTPLDVELAAAAALVGRVGSDGCREVEALVEDLTVAGFLVSLLADSGSGVLPLEGGKELPRPVVVEVGGLLGVLGVKGSADMFILDPVPSSTSIPSDFASPSSSSARGA
jgi:hypothetical protein